MRLSEEFRKICDRLSDAYICMASAVCFWLLRQVEARAVSRARVRAGSSIEARIAMIAITTSSSIRVNLLRFLMLSVLLMAEK